MNYDFDVEEAFRIWGYGNDAYKGTADSNVLDYYKENGLYVLEKLKSIRDDFYKSKAYNCKTVKEMFDNSIEDFLELYPDFPSRVILTWLGKQYCYDWK